MQKTFKSKKVGPKRIYDVAKAAETIGACEATIRNWIKSGDLKCFVPGRQPLLLGRDILECLAMRRARTKHPLGPDEFFCFGCKRPTQVTKDSLIATPNVLGFIRVEGDCTVCRGHCCRSFKPTDPFVDQIRENKDQILIQNLIEDKDEI